MLGLGPLPACEGTTARPLPPTPVLPATGVPGSQRSAPVLPGTVASVAGAAGLFPPVVGPGCGSMLPSHRPAWPPEKALVDLNALLWGPGPHLSPCIPLSDP